MIEGSLGRRVWSASSTVVWSGDGGSGNGMEWGLSRGSTCSWRDETVRGPCDGGRGDGRGCKQRTVFTAACHVNVCDAAPRGVATAGVRGVPLVINLDVFGEGVSPSVSSGATIAVCRAVFLETGGCGDVLGRPGVSS